jgi:hypothetical protein
MVAQEAIRLEYRMQLGESREYRASVRSDQVVKDRGEIASATVLADLTLLQKVVEVKPPDTYRLHVLILGGVVRRNGDAAEIPNRGQVIPVELKKNGAVVQGFLDLPFSQSAFPDRSLRQGDTWSGQSGIVVPVTGPDGKMAGVRREYLTYSYSLWGFRRIMGYDCAQIHVVCPQTRIVMGPGYDQTVLAAGTTFFAYKEGRMVRSEVETTTVMTSPDTSVTNTVKVVIEIHEASTARMAAGGEEFIIR